MSKFCKYCGKPLNGTDCDCADAVNERQSQAGTQPAAPTETPVQPQAAPVQPQAAPVQPQMAPVQTQTAATSQAATEQFNKSKTMFLDFIKNPIDMMSKLPQISDKLTPFIFGGIHIVVVLLASLSVLGGSFGLCLLILLGVLLANAGAIGISFLFAKKQDAKTSFVDVAAAFCLATVFSTIVLILAAFIGLGSTGAALFLVLIAFLSWFVTGYIAAQSTIKTTTNKVFWIYYLVIILAVIIIFVLCRVIITTIAEQMFYSSFYW